MSRRALLVVLACVVPQQAMAAIDYKKLCAGTTPVMIPPLDLLEAAMENAGPLSPGVFDANRDGTSTHEERMRAIFDPTYCTAKATKDRCKDKDELTLLNIQTFLRLDALGKVGADGYPEFGKGKLKTDLIGGPSAIDLADDQAIQYDSNRNKNPTVEDPDEDSNLKFLLALDPAGRFYKLQCDDKDVSPAEKPDTGSNDDDKKYNGFRLSKDIDGLTKERGSREKLAKIDAAEISYVDDRENDNTTFNITATAGFDFSTNPAVNSIAFFRMERQRVRNHDGNPVADQGDISKFTGGYIYGANPESFGRYDFSAFYTADTENDSELGSFRMTWVPAFLQKIDRIPFGRARYFWKDGPAWALDANAIAYGGYVFDAGTNTDLTDKDGFVRAGGSIKATFWPAPKSPLLKRVTFDASYKYLANIVGPHSVEWLAAGANFDIDAGGNVILRFGYEKGDDEETLEHTDTLSMSLGVRF